jgi:hypothetical protein
MPDNTCAEIANYGYLESLKWARDQGFPWEEEVYHNLLYKEIINANILDWVFMNGCPCNPQNIFRTAEFSVAGLIWALKNLTYQTSDLKFLVRNAVEEYNLDLLVWMHKNKIPFPKDFPKLVRNSECAGIIFWWIEQKLPKNLRGIWREVKEKLDSRSDTQVKEAGMVVRYPQKAKWFILEIKEKQSKKEW